MVPVLNRPFLEHLLLYLKQHSIVDIILAMGYLPDPIKRILGDGNKHGVHITYLSEETPLGTAGAIKNAESLLKEAFVVFNGDVLTKIDLTNMISRHRESKPKASIALTPVDNPTIYGVVETDAEDMVSCFLEKPGWDKVTTNMINAGIYILEPPVLAHIPSSSPSMLERHLFPLLLQLGEPILSYPSCAYWIDIGTPEKYLKAHHDLLLQWGDKGVRQEGKSEVHTETQIEGPVLIGEGCVIHQQAQIRGPTVLGPECEIAKDAIVEGSVLWRGARVDEGAVLKNCVIGANSHIEERCNTLENCILGDNVTVKTGSTVANGDRIEPDVCFESG
jgi:mannose-1-phosphate guanylyltransferase